jgi:hypothetical protein
MGYANGSRLQQRYYNIKSDLKNRSLSHLQDTLEEEKAWRENVKTAHPSEVAYIEEGVRLSTVLINDIEKAIKRLEKRLY